mgnify:CR=1 FL=1
MAEFKTLISGELRESRGNPTGNNQYSEETFGPKVSYGESSEYLAARLKRDAPEYLDRIGTGKEAAQH